MLDLIDRHPFLFLGSRLKRLAERMQTDVLRVSDRVGMAMQPGQFPILAALEETGPAIVTDLAKALGLSQPAVSQTVAKLQQAGLVETSRDASDGRQKQVTLTPVGTRTLERARCDVWPLVDAAVREAIDALGGDFVGQLTRLEAALAGCPLSERARDLALRHLVPVEDAELDEIAVLMNRAYRNIGDARSWTSEEAYVTGDRTTAAALRAARAGAPDASLLAWRHREHGTIDGCVWLEPMDGDVWYMGSLVVEPRLQNAGLGRRLLAACEARMIAQGAREVEIDVVNVRDTLLAWYARRGYVQTGRSRPWPYEDQRYGAPKRDDLCFLILRKPLTA